jgi:hypothetical protein
MGQCRFVGVTNFMGYHIEVTNIGFVGVTKYMWSTVGSLWNKNHSTNIYIYRHLLKSWSFYSSE